MTSRTMRTFGKQNITEHKSSLKVRNLNQKETNSHKYRFFLFKKCKKYSVRLSNKMNGKENVHYFEPLNKTDAITVGTVSLILKAVSNRIHLTQYF